MEMSPGHFLLARLDDVARWAQSTSVWPLTWDWLAVRSEMMTVTSPEYDIARLGSEVFRSSPRQADLMIVSGRVAQKMAPVVKRLYDQMRPQVGDLDGPARAPAASSTTTRSCRRRHDHPRRRVRSRLSPSPDGLLYAVNLIQRRSARAARRHPRAIVEETDVPSTQTPPIAGLAIDPPSLRPPIDDASSSASNPPDCTRVWRSSRPAASRCCWIGRGGCTRARTALRRRLSSFEAGGHGGDRRGAGTPVGCASSAASRASVRSCRARPASGSRRIGPSAKSTICSASSSRGTRICGAFRCPATGRVIRSAKTIRCAGPRARRLRARRSAQEQRKPERPHRTHARGVARTDRARREEGASP